MAIRIRTVGDTVVALCAAETDKKEGDIYLDDNIHHALMDKFCHELLDYPRDPVAESQKLRDAEEELNKWLADQKIKTEADGVNVEGLKPCRQCGEKEAISKVKCFGNQPGVQCNSCCVLLGPYDIIEEAVEAWNLWSDGEFVSEN